MMVMMDKQQIFIASKTCTKCEGSGIISRLFFKNRKCKRCKGKGKIEIILGNFKCAGEITLDSNESQEEDCEDWDSSQYNLYFTCCTGDVGYIPKKVDGSIYGSYIPYEYMIAQKKFSPYPPIEGYKPITIQVRQFNYNNGKCIGKSCKPVAIYILTFLYGSEHPNVTKSLMLHPDVVPTYMERINYNGRDPFLVMLLDILKESKIRITKNVIHGMNLKYSDYLKIKNGESVKGKCPECNEFHELKFNLLKELDDHYYIYCCNVHKVSLIWMEEKIIEKGY